jgi:hypothetical protein
VAISHHLLIIGGPYLVQLDTQGQITIPVKNCLSLHLELHCNNFIGSIESIQDCEAREVNPAYLQAVAQQREATQHQEVLSAMKRQCFIENTKLQVHTVPKIVASKS